MSRPAELSIDADLDNLKTVRSFISETGKSLGASEEAIGDMCLVVDEAVTNVILHGYNGSEGTVKVVIEREDDALAITIRDRARPFDPSTVEAPHLEESLMERDYGGMGVFLINKLTDEARFRQLADGGNELCLIKKGAIQSLK